MISTTAVALSVALFIGSIIVTIIGYFLTQTMNDLKEVKGLSIKTKGELDVLRNDHDNKYENTIEKFDDLKDSIVLLTSEIKQLTAKIK